MPVVAINISPRLFASLQEMIEGGKYESPEQFLEVAIFNQLALERGKLSSLEPSHSRAAGGKAPEPVNGSRALSTAATPAARKSKSGDDDRTAMEEALIRMRGSGWHGNTPRPFDLPNADFDGHIWGQVNRLLPLKIACRWLAVRASAEGDWPRLRTVSDDLADDAAAIGTGLELVDTSMKRKRDDRLATGLPRRGNAASRDRFISQYIARTTRSGEIYAGAICQFGLARVEFDEIGLTAPGIELAAMHNPVLDAPIAEAIATLSGQERSFLIKTVSSGMPTEMRDVTMVLESARAGNTSPTALLESVKSRLPREWTDLAKRTHIAGVLARCTDLDLIRRRWEGRNVTYELSDLAKSGWECSDSHNMVESVI